MAKISVDIQQDEIEGDYGPCEGLRVVCERCGHEVEVLGTSDRSAGYAAVKLREECPNGESNFYDTPLGGVNPSKRRPTTDFTIIR